MGALLSIPQISELPKSADPSAHEKGYGVKLKGHSLRLH